jgi:hypothetical protein
MTINTRDENGVKQPLDAETADAVTKMAQAAYAIATERLCGFVPPTPGYAPCPQEKGHEGPCSHHYSLCDVPRGISSRCTCFELMDSGSIDAGKGQTMPYDQPTAAAGGEVDVHPTPQSVWERENEERREANRSGPPGPVVPLLPPGPGPVA